MMRSAPRPRGMRNVVLIVLAAVALTMAAAVLGSLFLPREPLAELLMHEIPFHDWPSAVGIESFEGIGLVRDVKRVGGYALKAAETGVATNRTLVRVPKALTISATTVPSTIEASLDAGADAMMKALYNASGPNDALEAAKIDVGVVRVMSALIHERQKGPKSRWFPWINEVVPDVIPSMVQWDAPTAKHCLAPHSRTQWESSLRQLGRYLRAMRAAAAVEPRFEVELGVDLSHRSVMPYLQWAYSVIRSRGYRRPAPEYMVIVPVLDLADARAALMEAPSDDTAGMEATLVGRRLERIVEEGHAATVVFDADESGSVALASASPMRKDANVWIRHQRNFFTPVENLALFGFVDPRPLVVNSYINAETLQLPKGKALPPTCKHDAGTMVFSARTGAPHPTLQRCLEEAHGADNATIAAFIANHARSVLTRVHTEELMGRCTVFAASKQATVASRLLARHEKMMLDLFRGIYKRADRIHKSHSGTQQT